jgi:hypothetical protein
MFVHLNSCSIILQNTVLKGVQFGRNLLTNWSNGLSLSSGWQNLSPKSRADGVDKLI